MTARAARYESTRNSLLEGTNEAWWLGLGLGTGIRNYPLYFKDKQYTLEKAIHLKGIHLHYSIRCHVVSYPMPYRHGHLSPTPS